MLPTMYPTLLLSVVLLVTLQRRDVQRAIEQFVSEYDIVEFFGPGFSTIMQICGAAFLMVGFLGIGLATAILYFS